jgi:hypothetical protein
LNLRLKKRGLLGGSYKRFKMQRKRPKKTMNVKSTASINSNGKQNWVGFIFPNVSIPSPIQSGLNSDKVADNLIESLWGLISVAKVGYYWYSSKASASVVHELQRQFAAKKKSADEYRQNLSDTEASLGTQRREKATLVRIQPRFWKFQYLHSFPRTNMARL